MGVRRDAREAAVQYLYQREVHGDESDEGLQEFYKLRGISPSARKFSDELLAGWLRDRARIDDLISRNCRNFALNRLSAVDRNVLRIASHELIGRPDTPPAVVINEAIEIAKKYSSADSGRFVNGVLDNIRRELSTAPRTT
jgi:transcription antitermination protein NusB